MNKLDSDLFSKVAAYLSDSDLSALKIVWNKLVQETINKNHFWKLRTELLLGFGLKSMVIGWKFVYYGFAEALRKSSAHITNLEFLKILMENNKTENAYAFKVLLENCIDPSINQDIIGQNLLIESIKYGCDEITKIILNDSRIDPSAQDNEALHLSAICKSSVLRTCHLAVVFDPMFTQTLLLNANMPVNILVNKQVQIWIKYCNRNILELLIKNKKIDPSSRNNSLISILSGQGDVELIKLLLQDPRVDPSVNNNEALVKAAKLAHYEIVGILLKNSKINLNPSNIVSILNIRFLELTPKHIDCLNMLLSCKNIDPLDTSHCPLYILKNKYEPILRNAIRNKWSGMLAGWFYINSEDLPKNRRAYAFYNKFLKYLIRNKVNILTAITKLTKLAENSGNTNKIIVNKATNNILHNEPINNLSKLRTNVCYALKGFLLLSYRPRYTFFEILDIMKKDNVSKDGLALIAKLIGAYLGLEKLIKQGLKISSKTEKRIKIITDSDMSHLYGD
jgi:hypothetical protein